MWKLNGYFCEHATPHIIHCKLKKKDFVFNYFKKEKYIQCYDSMIHLILDKEL